MYRARTTPTMGICITRSSPFAVVLAAGCTGAAQLAQPRATFRSAHGDSLAHEAQRTPRLAQRDGPLATHNSRPLAHEHPRQTQMQTTYTYSTFRAADPLLDAFMNPRASRASARRADCAAGPDSRAHRLTTYTYSRFRAADPHGCSCPGVCDALAGSTRRRTCWQHATREALRWNPFQLVDSRSGTKRAAGSPVTGL